MTESLIRIAIALGLTLLMAWLALVILLVAARSKGLTLKEASRLLPDMLRLMRRLAADRSLPRDVQMRLLLLLGYLAFPFDLIPDFIPVIGHLDDAVIILAVLRSVVKRSGPEAVRRHWAGTEEGLAALFMAAGLGAEAERGRG
ncbi:MAG: hypothetical protein A2W26_01495 [Acidobacteria bacterium RBG_16_64_8]|nr:MAG: hypothetical protein A2W26_01495 [Acidobacteria bacterium RBG_16_64_8]